MKRLKKFRVRYARTVIMEVIVKATSVDAVHDIGLPGVYEGIDADLLGPHIEKVVDEENIWEVTKA